jgi:hypothetical protein
VMVCANGSGHVYVEPAFAFAAVVLVIGAIEVVDLGCDQAVLAAERLEVQSLSSDSAHLGSLARPSRQDRV